MKDSQYQLKLQKIIMIVLCYNKHMMFLRNKRWYYESNFKKAMHGAYIWRSIFSLHVWNPVNLSICSRDQILGMRAKIESNMIIIRFLKNLTLKVKHFKRETTFSWMVRDVKLILYFCNYFLSLPLTKQF